MTLKSRLAGHPEFAKLEKRFAAELPARIQAIEAAAAALQRSPRDVVQAQALFVLVHRLAGSCALYGYTGLSAAAGDLEHWLSGDAPAPEIHLPSDLSALPPFLQRLRSELAQGLGS